MKKIIDVVGNGRGVERFGQEDINSLLHGYWLDEVYGDVVESPNYQDYELDESYRQWCEEGGK